MWNQKSTFSIVHIKSLKIRIKINILKIYKVWNTISKKDLEDLPQMKWSQIMIWSRSPFPKKWSWADLISRFPIHTLEINLGRRQSVWPESVIYHKGCDFWEKGVIRFWRVWFFYGVREKLSFEIFFKPKDEIFSSLA